MTVDKIVVNIDRAFSPVQGYVALRRVHLKTYCLLTTMTYNDCRKKYADPEVKKSLQQMPNITF